MFDELALLGGPQAVKIARPHEIWPPEAQPDELAELARQRDEDISIRSRVGPIRGLEDDFRAFLDNQVRYAITFNSGTSALFAGYFALGVEEGVEVLGPALTYHAALSPVYTLRGDVVLVDVDERTRCVDPAQIERRITDRTKILTVVHQWGHPCDMDAVLAIADRHDLRLLEDCSHAHGSRYKGRPCGTFGDAAVFSLQANKAVFGGEGGILVTNDEKVHARATLLGRYRDRCRDELPDQDHRRYWVTGFGLKLRMSPFNAVVARHSLRQFPHRMRERHRCLTYLTERLHGIDYLDPVEIDKDVDMGAWYGYKPLYRPERLGGLPRARLIEALRAEGMEVGAPSGPCLASLPLYHEERDPLFPSRTRTRPNDPNDYPVADRIEQTGLSLPTFSDWDRDRELIDQYANAFAKVGARHHEL